MVLATTISRVSDGLPLAASVDDDQVDNALTEHKQQAKLIVRRLTPNSEPLCSIESGAYTLHYILSHAIIYLVIAERSYPRKLAFSYLGEIEKEFQKLYGSKVESATRPYAFVGFDTFMSRCTRQYKDSRTAPQSTPTTSGLIPESAASNPPPPGAQGNLGKINEDLQDVTRIMTKNMEDLLWRGDSLDRMSDLSSSLRSESLKYRKQARNINLEAMLRQYAPVGVIGLMLIVFMWWRFF